MHLVSDAIPPGRSDTVTVNRMRRWSAASPLSMTLPNTGVSTLPPHSGTTTFFPLYFPKRGPPGSRAARAAAPAPSVTVFSISMRRSMAIAMRCSDTVHDSSTHRLAIAKALCPTSGTARPSASVGPLNMATGRPASRAAENEGTWSGSTPTTWR